MFLCLAKVLLSEVHGSYNRYHVLSIVLVNGYVNWKSIKYENEGGVKTTDAISIVPSYHTYINKAHITFDASLNSFLSAVIPLQCSFATRTYG